MERRTEINVPSDRKANRKKDTNISATCPPPPSIHPWSWMTTDTNVEQNDSKYHPFFIFNRQNKRERRELEKDRKTDRGGDCYSMASWFSWSALLSSLASLPSLLLLLFLCLCLRWLSPSSLSCLLLLLLLKGMRKTKVERTQ